MPELPILPTHPVHLHEELVLVGLRLNGQHDGPQLYTVLAVGGDNERPIVAEGRLVFFTQPGQAAKAVAFDSSFAKLGSPPQEMESFCDVAEVLHLVNSQDADADGVVLDCLLILDDLIRATRLHMPDRYQAMLTELAARLTERQSLRQIFTNRSLREHVEDALLWCVGAIAVKSRILHE
ncbi:MAG TPA: hypothetical protein VK976_18895 [Verrucomicrobiae bacterium]|jgi:hypothetical protein|nr:hypothetical protein [Verrucomicrobiae bacterium]